MLLLHKYKYIYIYIRIKINKVQIKIVKKKMNKPYYKLKRGF